MDLPARLLKSYFVTILHQLVVLTGSSEVEVLNTYITDISGIVIIDKIIVRGVPLVVYIDDVKALNFCLITEGFSLSEIALLLRKFGIRTRHGGIGLFLNS